MTEATCKVCGVDISHLHDGARGSNMIRTCEEHRRKTTTAQRRPSLRRAIDAMCKYCIFDPHGGGGKWRQQTEACTSTTCPLYAVRPTTNGSASG